MTLRRARNAIATLLGAVALSACATAGSVPPGTLRSAGLSIDELLLVRQHTRVLAVAASARRVFMLSDHGLALYDRTFERWEPPSSALQADLERELFVGGFGVSRGVVLSADPFEDAVWIGVPGAVVQVRTTSPQRPDVRRIAIAGTPEVIAFARGDAGRVLVRASGQWTELSRAGFASPIAGGVSTESLLLPAQLEAVYREHPALRGQLAFVLREPGSSVPPRADAAVVAGTLSPDQPSEVWIGTRNDGVWRVDANFMQATQLSYGVLDEDVGALALAADGVWAAGQGRTGRSGLTAVGASLQSYEWVGSDGGTDGLLPGLSTRALAVRGDRAWVGTDRGLMRLSTSITERTARGASRSRQWGAPQGLPDERVLAVVPRATGAWVGTARGLAFVHDDVTAGSSALPVSGAVQSMGLAGSAVYALALAEDVLFVGTDRGLYAVSGSAPDADDPSLAATDARLVLGNTGRVMAAAWSDSVVLVATSNGAYLLRRPRSLAEVSPLDASVRRDSVALLARTDLAALGPIVAAAVDDRTVWLAGPRGVWARPRAGGTARLLPASGGPDTDFTALVIDGRWAWVGTHAGLIRVARAPDGGLP